MKFTTKDLCGMISQFILTPSPDMDVVWQAMYDQHHAPLDTGGTFIFCSVDYVKPIKYATVQDFRDAHIKQYGYQRGKPRTDFKRLCKFRDDHGRTFRAFCVALLVTTHTAFVLTNREDDTLLSIRMVEDRCPEYRSVEDRFNW